MINVSSKCNLYKWQRLGSQKQYPITVFVFPEIAEGIEHICKGNKNWIWFDYLWKWPRMWLQLIRFSLAPVSPEYHLPVPVSQSPSCVPCSHSLCQSRALLSSMSHNASICFINRPCKCQLHVNANCTKIISPDWQSIVWIILVGYFVSLS